jgi:hypothetical protein
MIQQVEQLLIDRLKATPNLGNLVHVLGFPGKPNDDAARIRGSAAILVKFGRMKLEPEGGNGYHTLQHGSLDFEFRLLVKDLRSHVGAYDLIEIIVDRISRYQPPNLPPWSFGVSGFQVSEAVLIDRGEAIWDWGMTAKIDLIYHKE